jgi:hypothetical protein
VDFAPHIRIDWTLQRVEVDVVVVLRDGLLELVACRPGTREHESIFVAGATAVHIYQALGLIGLEPGSPPSWDPLNETLVPSTGPTLRILVQHGEGDDTTVDNLNHWLWDARQDRQVEGLSWVFSGSVEVAGAGLAAEYEGTLITVVDFGSALISPSTSYSESNEMLWLVPHTEVMPAVGTRCVLIIESAELPSVTISVGRFGRFLYDGEPVRRAALPQVLTAARTRGVARVVIRPLPGVASFDVDAVRDVALHSGYRRGAIRAEAVPQLSAPSWLELKEWLTHTCAARIGPVDRIRLAIVGPRAQATAVWSAVQGWAENWMKVLQHEDNNATQPR